MLAVVALLIAAIAMAPAGSALAKAKPKPPLHKLVVLHGTRTLATFTVARCSVIHGAFVAIVPHANKDSWGLYVKVDHWTGWHDYAMEQDPDANAWVYADPPDEVAFSNLNVPKIDNPPFAGEVNFSAADHGLVGVGANPAWNEASSDAVTIAGVLRCRWTKRSSVH